jgi:hypothetical protein
VPVPRCSLTLKTGRSLAQAVIPSTDHFGADYQTRNIQERIPARTRYQLDSRVEEPVIEKLGPRADPKPKAQPTPLELGLELSTRDPAVVRWLEMLHFSQQKRTR